MQGTRIKMIILERELKINQDGERELRGDGMTAIYSRDA